MSEIPLPEYCGRVLPRTAIERRQGGDAPTHENKEELSKEKARLREELKHAAYLEGKLERIENPVTVAKMEEVAPLSSTTPLVRLQIQILELVRPPVKAGNLICPSREWIMSTCDVDKSNHQRLRI